jgi:hypothetical protein
MRKPFAEFSGVVHTLLVYSKSVKLINHPKLWKMQPGCGKRTKVGKLGSRLPFAEARDQYSRVALSHTGLPTALVPMLPSVSAIPSSRPGGQVPRNGVLGDWESGSGQLPRIGLSGVGINAFGYLHLVIADI